MSDLGIAQRNDNRKPRLSKPDTPKSPSEEEDEEEERSSEPIEECVPELKGAAKMQTLRGSLADTERETGDAGACTVDTHPQKDMTERPGSTGPDCNRLVSDQLCLVGGA